MATEPEKHRLTEYAHGGGCAYKIPPGELERVVAGLDPWTSPNLRVGLETGDDAAVVKIDQDRAAVATTDFFTPVVDDAHDFGRIAATNALSDIYAMGGSPLIGLNIVGRPATSFRWSCSRKSSAAAQTSPAKPSCTWPAGTASTTPSPNTGWPWSVWYTPTECSASTQPNPAGTLTLTKPLGIGVLNNRHKATGQPFPEAIWMTQLNAAVVQAALAVGAIGGEVPGYPDHR